MNTTTTILQHIDGSTDTLNDVDAIIPINVWIIAEDGVVKRGDGIHTFKELVPLANLYDLMDLWQYMYNQRDMLSTIQSGNTYVQCHDNGTVSITNGTTGLTISNNADNVAISTMDALAIGAEEVRINSVRDVTINGDRVLTEADNLSAGELQNSGTKITIDPTRINIVINEMVVGHITTVFVASI
jgi:hypothetical protein